MKGYISVDIEGTSGVVNIDQISKKGKEYERARKWMTEETVKAVEILHSHDINEIIVADSHGGMTNLLFEEFPAYVELIQGNLRPLSMVSQINRCDFGLFLGYHAGPVSQAILGHVISGVFADIKLNGQPINEFYLNALTAGYYDVPIIFLAGDQAICDFVNDASPEIVTMATKKGISALAGRTKTLPQVKKEFEEKISLAIEKWKNDEISPLTIEEPIQLELTFQSPKFADVVGFLPTATRKDGTSIMFEVDNIVKTYSLIKAITIMANGMRRS